MIGILKRFFAFCSEENRKKFYISLLSDLVMSLFEALKIPAIAIVIRALLEGNVTGMTALKSFLVMLISVLGSGLVKYTATMRQTEGGYNTCAEKRVEIARHMRSLPMGYFNESSLGYITSVTTNTLQNLENVATRVVMLVSHGILMTAAIIVMLLFFDPRISLFLLAGTILFLLVNSVLVRKSERVSRKKLAADAVLVERILEYIQGMPEIKTYHLTGKENRRLMKAVDDNCRTNTKMEMTMIPYMGLQMLIVKLMGVLMAFLSVLFYLGGSMDLLVCIMMIISSFIVCASLETAGNYSGLLRTVDTCVEQTENILSVPAMDEGGADLTPKTCDIEMKHVTFAYEDRVILDDVSLKIPAGSSAAFVGPSGGGKTTVTRLMARFWDADSGEVLLGGRNVKDYSMDSLMKSFSFVFQNVYLFNDTVANNIRYGVPDASLEDVMAAAKKACAYDFIMALSEGFDTVIGEGGASLSGGEKQRISVARAIMKDAPVIILDEATANVDPENEAELVAAISTLTAEKTVIMIAHRLKTVRGADQIFVLDHGKIVQEGRHEELAEEEGIYRNFIRQRMQAAGWKLRV